LARRVKKLKSVASVFEELRPAARADVRGAGIYSAIRGEISFYRTPQGVAVVWEVSGLGRSCTGTPADPFADTDAHFNPGKGYYGSVSFGKR
jgi:hypothetical protein